MAIPAQSNEHRSDHLHPLIYAAIVGLAVWLLVSAWVFFGGAGYIELALAMISVLVFMTIAIPLMLSRAAAARTSEAPPDAPSAPPESFDRWLRGELDTWTGRCRSRTAAIEILLPIAAVAFGMTAFGIVYMVAHAGIG